MREPAASKGHVLVVEDDEAVRLGVREYLRASGYEVSEAGTSTAGQDAFRAARVDVALVDYQLPDGNALHLLKAYKSFDSEVGCRRGRPCRDRHTDRHCCDRGEPRTANCHLPLPP
jgi:CheY-like chemotaxis protein